MKFPPINTGSKITVEPGGGLTSLPALILIDVAAFTDPFPVAKSIEKKADEGNLKHKHITKELRLQIQQARNSKGLTQKQLANNCQLTQQIINDIESGKAIYNHQHINKIKRYLKIK